MNATINPLGDRSEYDYDGRGFLVEYRNPKTGVQSFDRAALANVAIMRSFVRLRQVLASNAQLAQKLANLEKRYDTQFKVVFDAIRELMAPEAPPPQRRIGFRHDDKCEE